MDISIIGTGYVGLVTGICLAELGHRVICVDVDKDRVEKINNGIPPIYEEGLESLLIKHGKNGTLRATDNLKEALMNSEISFICVGTPKGFMEYIDLKYVEQASRDIGKILLEKKEFHVVVVKSTVIPGTTVNSVLPLLEKHSKKKSGKDFGVAMNPEFLREGKAIKDFMAPDRIVIGTLDSRSLTILKELYNQIDAPVVETDPTTAEMIKYATNSFLVTKISFINEIGNICKLLGVDVYRVAEGLGLDSRVSPHFLNAGIGFGGSCFPKDVKALLGKAKEVYYHPTILNAAFELNESQALKIVELLEKAVGPLKGKDVVILGLAFKPGTDDMREAPSIRIIHTLLKKGSKIHATDPKAIGEAKKIFGNHPDISYYESPEKAVKKSKYILIVTEWDEFRKEGLYLGKVVIDGRRIDEARAADYYDGVCW